ncbi:MAG: hypothetical protein HY077_12035 [Elusimicrobia bacterium]|nr:hypothetical protein [Elusimicrobiota bacterium]
MKTLLAAAVFLLVAAPGSADDSDCPADLTGVKKAFLCGTPLAPDDSLDASAGDVAFLQQNVDSFKGGLLNGPAAADYLKRFHLVTGGLGLDRGSAEFHSATVRYMTGPRTPPVQPGGGAVNPDADLIAPDKRINVAGVNRVMKGSGELNPTIVPLDLGPNPRPTNAPTTPQLLALNAIPNPGPQTVRNGIVPTLPQPVTDGLIANAQRSLDEIGEDRNTGPFLRATVATGGALFQMFNLPAFEQSVHELSLSASDPAVSRGQTIRDAGATAGNGILSVLSGVSGGTLAKLVEVTRVSSLGKWATTAFRGLTAGESKVAGVTAAQGERIAALEQRIAAGNPLTREEAAWLAEARNGKADVVFHATNAMNEIVESGRVAATTERFVYAAKQQINSMFRQLLSGVKPKEGLIILQGDAAKLFSSHEATGLYSGLKRLAGQQITNGEGDIIITKAFFNAETKTLTITEARMATEAEQAFKLQSKTRATARLWGRRVLLDGGLTTGTAFVASPSQAKETILEYTLGSTSGG